MRLIVGFLFILMGCSNRTEVNFESTEYVELCNQQCKKDYGTEVDWVGPQRGVCYCK